MAKRNIPDLVEDRYEGVMFDIADCRKEPNSTRDYRETTSELYDALDNALREMVFHLVRHDCQDTVNEIVEELHLAIRERAVVAVSEDVERRVKPAAVA